MLRIGIFGSTVLILTAGAALAWPSQAGPPGAQGHPSLREYYEGLVKGTMAPPQLTNETGGRFLERVTSATHDEVSEALPAILAASQSKDPDVQRFGILALLAVNDRHSDQYELLSKYLPELTALLSSGDSRRSEEHTSELQSRLHLVCRLLLEKKKKN